MPNWDLYPNFTKEEFDCKHTGLNEMRSDFMDALQDLRERCGFPFIVTSGYRASTHPIEIKKSKPGEHSYGLAADIKVEPHQRYVFVLQAMACGFTRIGISNDFIHVGRANEDLGFPSPALWGYNK